MKNVLLPTDFSANSLDHIGPFARHLGEKVSFTLFHAIDMPGSLLEAMRKAGLRGHDSLITEDIRTRCRRIKQANPNISNIYFRIMYGTTVAAFRNYAEANNIDIIAIPAGYKFTYTTRESVDPMKMFQKSGIQILRDVSPLPPITGSDGSVLDWLQLA